MRSSPSVNQKEQPKVPPVIARKPCDVAIRIPSDAQHRPLPEGAERERIATGFALAMTGVVGSRCFCFDPVVVRPDPQIRAQASPSTVCVEGEVARPSAARIKRVGGGGQQARTEQIPSGESANAPSVSKLTAPPRLRAGEPFVKYCKNPKITHVIANQSA